MFFAGLLLLVNRLADDFVICRLFPGAVAAPPSRHIAHNFAVDFLEGSGLEGKVHTNYLFGSSWEHNSLNKEIGSMWLATGHESGPCGSPRAHT